MRYYDPSQGTWRRRLDKGECMASAEMEELFGLKPPPLELAVPKRPRSRLVMLSGTECYMEFTAPMPNAWRRFWCWFLLGFLWLRVEEKDQ